MTALKTLLINRKRQLALIAAGLSLTVGCAGRPSLLPNSDSTLRKTSTEFAVDASHRFPFKADAPDGGKAEARAQAAYMFKRVEIENLSGEDCTNVEVWINKSYVVFVPKMESKKLKQLPFQMFYDDTGHYFPKDGSSQSDSLVHQLNIFRDGRCIRCRCSWQINRKSRLLNQVGRAISHAFFMRLCGVFVVVGVSGAVRKSSGCAGGT